MMNIDSIYLDNYNDLLFAKSSKVQLERDKVLNKFKLEYFNKKNNESLKNIDLNQLLNFKYNYVNASKKCSTKASGNTYNIYLVNGKCEDFEDEKVQISNLTSEDSNFFFNNKFSSLNDFLIDMNSLFLNSGIKIEIKKNQKIHINIENFISENNLSIFQKNFISCKENSKVSILEKYNNKYLSIHNVYNLFDIDQNSKLDNYIIQQNSIKNNLYLSSYSTCKKNSFFNQSVYNFSEGYVRNNHFSELIDENSEVSHTGFFFIKDNNISDNKTYVKHLATNCKSNQIYKGVLENNSKASYFSNTYVDKDAQKTEGYQLSKGILLSESTTFFSKPELRIFADDVKCSHGSTIGPIDESSIFYLRSRGIKKSDAIKMLISAFVNDDLQKIENNKIITVIEKNLMLFLKNL
tara:strand:- start:18694 stop:19917 length:1224 start_codon:yes stop_codon:yes gene_type:complete